MAAARWGKSVFSTGQTMPNSPQTRYRSTRSSMQLDIGKTTIISGTSVSRRFSHDNIGHGFYYAIDK